jgi:hypothetical protein
MEALYAFVMACVRSSAAPKLGASQFAKPIRQASSPLIVSPAGSISFARP